AASVNLRRAIGPGTLPAMGFSSGGGGLTTSLVSGGFVLVSGPLVSVDLGGLVLATESGDVTEETCQPSFSLKSLIVTGKEPPFLVLIVPSSVAVLFSTCLLEKEAEAYSVKPSCLTSAAKSSTVCSLRRRVAAEA